MSSLQHNHILQLRVLTAADFNAGTETASASLFRQQQWLGEAGAAAREVSRPAWPGQ